MSAIKTISDRIAEITGAGPAFKYVSAPTPATERVVLSDGVRYTPSEALTRLTAWLVEADRGDAPAYYCRAQSCQCGPPVQLTKAARDAHEQAVHRGMRLRTGVAGQ